jgi:hypothetical protein
VRHSGEWRSQHTAQQGSILGYYHSSRRALLKSGPF